MNPINTEMFSWNKDSLEFSACASTGPLHELFRPGNRIPRTLLLKSHVTGNVIEAVYSHKEVNADEDINYWAYYNHDHFITVLIFND